MRTTSMQILSVLAELKLNSDQLFSSILQSCLFVLCVYCVEVILLAATVKIMLVHESAASTDFLIDISA